MSQLNRRLKEEKKTKKAHINIWWKVIYPAVWNNLKATKNDRRKENFDEKTN